MSDSLDGKIMRLRLILLTIFTILIRVFKRINTSQLIGRHFSWIKVDE